jgi:hypothetical protein
MKVINIYEPVTASMTPLKNVMHSMDITMNTPKQKCMYKGSEG